MAIAEILNQIFNQIAATAAASIAVNSAYDIFKYLASKTLEKHIEKFVDDEVLNNIYDALDTASDSFFQRYGDTYGKPAVSFLARQSNIQLFIKFFYYDAEFDLQTELDRRGYDDAKELPTEVVSWFVSEFISKAMEYQNLGYILLDKKHIKETGEIKKYLHELAANVKKSGSRDFSLAKAHLYKTEFVVGREHQIKEIEKVLSGEKKAVNIYGIPGAGRKTFCRYFINTYRENSDVFWIYYDGNLLNSIIKTFSSVISRTEDIDVIMHELNTNPVYKGALLVISDFNNINDENLKLVFQLKIPVIITSCLNFNSDFVYDYSLKLLPEDTCSELFLHYCPKAKGEDESLLLELIHLAGNHTLAVKLLAKTAEVNHLSLDGLLLQLKENGFNMSREASRLVENDATYALPSEHLEKLFYWTGLGTAELDLLTQLSVLPCQGIEESLLYSMGFNYANIQVLIQNGFAEETGTVLTMNNVIQNVVREKTQPDFQKCAKTINCILNGDFNCQYYGASIVNWIHECNETLVSLCILVGNTYTLINLNKFALEYFLKAEERNNPIQNSDKYRYIIYANKANSYFYIGNYIEAHANISLAYPKFHTLFIGGSENDIIILSSAVMIFNQYGETDKAEQSFKRAIKLYKKNGSQNKELLFALYNNVAKMYVNLQDYQKAEQHYLLAKQQLDGLDSDEYLYAWYLNYGIMLVETGGENLSRAKECFETALEIAQNCESRNYRNIAVILKETGKYYSSTGEYKPAIDFFHKAIKTFEDNDIENPIEKGKIFYDLGNTYLKMKNHPEAKNCYQKAYKLFKSGVLPQNHDIFKKIEAALFLMDFLTIR